MPHPTTAAALSALCLLFVCATSHADPSAAPGPDSSASEPAFGELVLSFEYRGPAAASFPGPTRRVLRVRANGELAFLRTHPLLRFRPCQGRATREELERLARLLPANLEQTSPGEADAPSPPAERDEASSAFLLECRGVTGTRRARGLEHEVEAAGLAPLFKALEGLARRLVAVQPDEAIRVRGRVEVRPLGGRFEVLVATDEGEISVGQPLAQALRPLKGYEVLVAGELDAGGELGAGRLLDPLPLRLEGEAVRLARGPGLRIGGRVLEGVGARQSALAEASGHRVRVAGWRYASGRLVIDSVGAAARRASAAERRGQAVADHAAGAALRVLQVAPARGLALVQDTHGGRIGWIPRAALRWSAEVDLPGPEGSEGLSGKLEELE